MSTPTLRYDLIADDKTAKGIRSAKKNVSLFENKIKELGKTFASVFAAQKILGFAKDVSQAFMEDQKSAAILSNTVKNLGLSFADLNIKTFIDQLSMTSGVVDDELRPAFQRLLQATKDLGRSKDLLSNAIDISRGSGQSLETVVLDLANAYVGNNRGLKKYTLGLSMAELKTASFDTVLKAFNKNFSGANKAYLKTYAGQLDRLTVAANESKEILGKGLIDSLALLGKDGSVGNLAQNMQDFATYTSNAIYGVASLANELKNLGSAAPSWLTTALKYLAKTAPGAGLVNGLNALSSYGERKRNSQLENPSTLMFKQDEANNRINNMVYKKQQDAAKKQLDATKKLTAEQKKQAALKKAGTVFDMEQIQLIAALKGKLSEQDKLRAEAQLALLNGNDVVATKLTKEILASQDATGNLAKLLTSLPDANNPFKYLEAYLDTLKEKVKTLYPSGNVPPVISGGAGNTQVLPQTNAQDYSGFALNTDMPGTAGSGAQFGSSTPWAQAGTIVVQIDGKAIAEATQAQSLNGNQTYVDRRTGGFNW